MRCTLHSTNFKCTGYLVQLPDKVKMLNDAGYCNRISYLLTWHKTDIG